MICAIFGPEIVTKLQTTPVTMVKIYPVDSVSSWTTMKMSNETNAKKTVFIECIDIELGQILFAPVTAAPVTNSMCFVMLITNKRIMIKISWFNNIGEKLL